MQTIITTIHVIAAILLILIILLQQGKGGGLSGLVGGGSGMDDVLSSPSGDVFLKKATVTLAVIFFLTSLILTVRSTRVHTESILDRQGVPQREAPAVPWQDEETMPEPGEEPPVEEAPGQEAPIVPQD